MPVALTVILTVGGEIQSVTFQKRPKHVLQMVPEQLSIYFGYALDRRFRQILPEYQEVKTSTCLFQTIWFYLLEPKYLNNLFHKPHVMAHPSKNQMTEEVDTSNSAIQVYLSPKH